MNIVNLAGWVLAVAFLGCGSTEMTATGPAVAPRAPNCDFEIMTSTPLLGYREVGTVDVTPGSGSINQFTNLGEFKEHIQPQVCQLGGDAAIAGANGYGMYIKASVLKRVATGEAPAVAQTAAPAPVNNSHGCEFDTQCKGDRLCVDNKCQEPQAKAPAPASSSTPAAAEPVPASPPKPAPAAAPAASKAFPSNQ